MHTADKLDSLLMFFTILLYVLGQLIAFTLLPGRKQALAVPALVVPLSLWLQCNRVIQFMWFPALDLIPVGLIYLAGLMLVTLKTERERGVEAPDDNSTRGIDGCLAGLLVPASLSLALIAFMWAIIAWDF